ncbi:MAG TPA: aminoacyl-tRNA hydrolase, partial [Gammaproteobacteria bacterium]|nr:aminoacyl-tRNA hydrolase [Gammaproteobacteria bacterium]
MSENVVRLVVGLGNPGVEYLATRHNVGFWFVDALAAELGAAFRATRRLHGESARATLGKAELLLLKPDTFVNRSGLAVRATLDYFKYEPSQLLVAHDDLDLAPGTVRVKRGGGHGGHNGLRDIIAHVGADFARLRFGIRHPAAGAAVIDYVLGAPPRAEEEEILTALGAA